MHRLMEALNIVSVTVTSKTSQKLNRSVALELVLLKRIPMDQTSPQCVTR